MGYDPASRFDAAGVAVNDRLIQGYGSIGSLPQQPWAPANRSGANLWATANFSTNLNGPYAGQTLNNTSTLSPSVTGNSSSHANASRMVVATASNNVPQRWRVQATINASGVTGAGSLRLRIKAIDGTGTVIPWLDALGNRNTSYIELTANSTVTLTNFVFMYELDLASDNADNVRASFLEVALVADSTATGGTMTLTNVTVYRVHQVTPQIRATWDRTNGGTIAAGILHLQIPAGTDSAGYHRLTELVFNTDGVLELSPGGATASYESGWTNKFALGSYNGRWPSSIQHVNNADTVISVVKTDASTELRGNTHNGEVGATGTYATDFQVFCDYGDGGGWVGPLLNGGAGDNYYRHCFRVKIVANTKMTRSDQGSPFALLTKTFYIYADGTVRCDRTFTFQQDQAVDKWFWHMTSLDPVTGRTPVKGKLGRGSQIIGAIDTLSYLPPPLLADTFTITTSGGAIVASTRPYSVRVTAYGAQGGETIANPYNSLIGTTISVTNSTLAVSWAAVSGAVGYNVYFGFPGMERFVAMTTSTSYTILGSEAPGRLLPTVNTAETGTKTTMASSGFAEWSAFYDTVIGHVYSLVVDRANILALPYVKGIRADLQRIDNSIMKNYWLLEFDNSGNDLPFTVPSGTVYSSTLWWFYYLPADPTFFEREQTLRASSAAQLPVVYTTT